MLFSKLFILVLVGTLHFSIAQSSSGDDETQAVGNAETHENRKNDKDERDNDRKRDDGHGSDNEGHDFDSPKTSRRSENLRPNNENKQKPLIMRANAFGSIGGSAAKIAVDAAQSLHEGDTFHLTISKDRNGMLNINYDPINKNGDDNDFSNIIHDDDRKSQPGGKKQKKKNKQRGKGRKNNQRPNRKGPKSKRKH